MNVLMNTGPWLPVPPPGYGGIENVVATLVPALRERGVRVVLASVGSSTLEVDELVSVYDAGQFAELQKPYNQVMGIAHAHQAMVAREVRRRDDVDLVHDHLEVVGPAVLSALGGPPVLHTLHWDLRKHAAFYGAFPGSIAVNGVSESQLRLAPAALRSAALGAIHLATPLAGAAPRAERGEHLVVLGRICRLKGQHLAARVCQKLGLPLVLAGPVSGLGTAAELDAVAQDPYHPLHGHPDVRYHLEAVAPYLDGDLVRWVGTVEGRRRDELYGSARAALFPVQWDEPGGTAVVEALALGVPVVGLRRGCLAELIDHGRTGWLADTEEELAEYVLRVDEIDPEECRAEAARRFTPAVMAERYLELYEAAMRRRRANA
ncbi:glycosyltransferase family 4 protein [Nonomuraea roseoviolacea subsp. roseoviolacea]|uniref:Glycosyltransferase involved in cell wall biosynthesis n=1 Tax=Nonomuraea roseoviolacea subsp. carminata TaxID=160689 RepID=A0ABT1JW45_9ACTN|nr:glycosyltransferase [Nonomuraea roseoviolacea]MCP2345456.1 glycosyltransferase involved in cell wall biosynthesis [Nonomuraea roseoviolacea subsp. carminata]